MISQYFSADSSFHWSVRAVYTNARTCDSRPGAPRSYRVMSFELLSCEWDGRTAGPCGMTTRKARATAKTRANTVVSPLRMTMKLSCSGRDDGGCGWMGAVKVRRYGCCASAESIIWMYLRERPASSVSGLAATTATKCSLAAASRPTEFCWLNFWAYTMPNR